jgi:hypothetical protein
MPPSILALEKVMDFENLRSQGYNRMLLNEYVLAPTEDISDLMNEANYGAGITIGNDGHDLVMATMIPESLAACLKLFVNVRANSTVATRYDIAATGFGGLRTFAEEWVKGYLGYKATVTPSDGWLVNTPDAALTAATADRLDRHHETQTGSEDWFRLVGYYMGLTAPRIFDTSRIEAAGATGYYRMARIGASVDLMTIMAAFPIAIIQSAIAKIQLGRKLGLVPAEYDFIADGSIDDVLLYLFENMWDDTDLHADDAVSIDHLTGYLSWNFAALPTATLLTVLTRRMRTWKVPIGSISLARNLFGWGKGDVSFPTVFGNFMTVGSESHLNSKIVGYDLLYAMWMLDQFFGPDGLAHSFALMLENEHWTMKGFKDTYDPKKIFQDFSLSTMKGFADPTILLPLLWHTRMESNAKTVGGYYSVHREFGDMVNGGTYDTDEVLVSLALEPPNSAISMYARGPWDMNTIGIYLLMELLFREGDDIGFNQFMLPLGEHYYTRREQVINYVACESGSDNVRYGSNVVWDGPLFDEYGLTMQDLVAAGLEPAVITARLPAKKYPLPVRIKDVYASFKEIAALVTALVRSNAASPGIPSPPEDTPPSKDNQSDEEDV